MSQRRRRADAILELPGDKEQAHQTCDWPGCQRLGDYRAPRSRDRLRTFFFFCLEHVRDYNRDWDFFSGMNQAEIEAYLREDVTWHRPTWKIGSPGNQHGDGWRWQDPFEVLINGPGMGGAEAKAEWDRPTSRLGRREQMLKVMGLEHDATPDELKARYKELVKKHHPDVNHGNKAAEERLKLINEAYTYLRGHERIV
ncbi:MAG: J domain-containing protein [Rhizobiales bacterium]|nr:J domain-containing protein [Hyphomicrobiales bacterium]